jgi:cobalamin 5'-phosphate synthase/cobalamin synthase
VKSFLAAVAFLTILPTGNIVAYDASAVARAAGWFPVVGALLGLISVAVAAVLQGHLPPGVVAVGLVILDALLTGALHFDGLADTADGFGGGKDREDTLRIMRDHNIGSFGAMALVLIVALKVTAYAALLGGANGMRALVLTPVLGRWSMLPLAAALPYARPSASVIDGMGKRSLIWGTVAIVVVWAAAWLLRFPSMDDLIAAAAVVAATALFGMECRRKIGGITGDTLGANLELSECAALLAFLWMGHAR